MNKKIPLGLAIAFAAICCTITAVFTSNISLGIFNDSVKDVKERAEIYEKLDNIDAYVRQYYFGETNQDKLIDSLSASYLSVLDDKYARYRTAAENEKEKKEDSGVMVGIGVSVQKDESGYILVDSVFENSPAEELGIVPGSLIVSVDEKDVLTEGYENSVKKIQGAVGSSVTLIVRVDGEDSEITLARREIEIISVTGKMIDDLGYIKITAFNEKTSDQFIDMVSSLIEEGAKGLIFDVRNNPGGLLTPTLEMVDYICPEGVIASATYKDGKKVTLGKSDSKEINMPMTVLVNSNSASASELFSSALRDFDKAHLVGETTFGKGIMQETFQLSDGSSITITTAKYQTLKTANFDGIGLNPNYEVIVENDTDADLKKLDETTDTQLKKAIEVLNATIE